MDFIVGSSAPALSDAVSHITVSHNVALAAVEADGGITAVGTVVTQVMSWVGTVLEFTTSHPIALLGVGFFVVFASVGLVRKFIRG